MRPHHRQDVIVNCNTFQPDYMSNVHRFKAYHILVQRKVVILPVTFREYYTGIKLYENNILISEFVILFYTLRHYSQKQLTEKFHRNYYRQCTHIWNIMTAHSYVEHNDSALIYGT